MNREVRQAHDGRGDAVDDPEFGPWQVLIDDCRADYTEWEHYTLDCSWFAGPPHNREITGREIWRREKTVTADGITWGSPEFVSTSCWEGRTSPLPQAEISENLDSYLRWFHLIELGDRPSPRACLAAAMARPCLRIAN